MMVASVLAFHLDNGSQQAGFHCLLSKARVSCAAKSPVLTFQLPSHSAHYSYTTPSPVLIFPFPSYSATKVVLPSRQFSSFQSLATLRTEFVLPSRQFSSSSSPPTPHAKVAATSHLPAPPPLRALLNLYYKVASSPKSPVLIFPVPSCSAH